ncbi:hypothetical protein [Acinetobacter rudis]|uniref:hypothetical protein n=1 Tax=Acinetobacter rudis TaxID=632955 RepID=UPI00333F5E50
MSSTANWEVGDRFIYVKNLTDSETIPLRFKGVVCAVYNGWVDCDGWGFDFGEIKKLVQVKG